MIALTTPTGKVGSQTLRTLLASTDQPLRVLARDRGRLPADAAARIEIVDGSLEDPAALHRLLDGARALFWCQPDPTTAPDYLRAYEDLSTQGCAAVRAAGVAHVVAVSTAGDRPERPAGPLTALHRMEAIVAGSGAACRFLRCGSFFENLLAQWHSIAEDGVFVYPAAGDVPGPQVAVADIADVAADWLVRDDWSGVDALQLVGPAPLTYGEMAETLGRVLGRAVAYQRVEPAAYREGLVAGGLSPSAADGLLDMFAFLENGYRLPADAVLAHTPTTLADWLRARA